MTVHYIITFRLDSSETYSGRYNALYDYFEDKGKGEILPSFLKKDNNTTSTIKWKPNSNKLTKEIADELIKAAKLLKGDIVEFIKITSIGVTSQGKPDQFACITEVGKIENQVYRLEPDILQKFKGKN